MILCALRAHRAAHKRGSRHGDPEDRALVIPYAFYINLRAPAFLPAFPAPLPRPQTPNPTLAIPASKSQSARLGRHQIRR